MATITSVDIGAAPDDGNGDPLRTAFSKLNTNDTNLNTDKIENVSEDTTPQLGGDLDTNGNSLVTLSNLDLLLEPNGTGAVSVIGVTDYENNVTADDDLPNKKFCDDTYLTDVVGDTTPQLGGDLDMNGNALVTLSNADVLLSPNGSGAVSVSEVTDYENNVTVDDDIPNKKFCDDTYLKQTESFTIALSDQTTALTTGAAKSNFFMPYAFTLTEVRANVATAPTGSVLTVDINESGATILSTKITIDVSEKTSTTAATVPVISDSSLADDAELTFDIDTIGSTIAGAGLKVTLIGNRT